MRRSPLRPFKRRTSQPETRELPQLSIAEFKKAWRTYQEGSPHELRFSPYKPRRKGWFTIVTRSPEGVVEFSAIPVGDDINDDQAFPSFFVYIEAILKSYNSQQNILGTHKIFVVRSAKGEGFSGGRLWFLCKGLSGKEQYGHPVGTLYIKNRVLACRNCHAVTYQSRNLSGRHKKQGRTYSEAELEAMSRKIKRSSYAGVPTKAVARYEKAVARNNKIQHTETEIALKTLEMMTLKAEDFIAAIEQKRTDAFIAHLEKEGDPEGILADMAKGDFTRFYEKLEAEGGAQEVIARWREAENIDDFIRAMPNTGEDGDIAKIIADLWRTKEY